MKKILALALVLALTLSLAACGGKEDPKPSGSSSADTNQQGQKDNEDNPNMRFGFYLSDAQLEKIDSLGKCEENKTIVAAEVIESNKEVHIMVYHWSDAAAKFDSYEKYYFFNPGDRYSNHLDSYGSGYNILEQNDTDEWFCIGLSEGSPLGESGLMTYKEIYDYCENGAGGDLIQ